jgi:DNA-binding beta-propeller fold protein YncE
MQRPHRALLVPLALLSLAATTPARAQGSDYLVYVASEAVDQVALVRWSPGTGRAAVEKRLSVGLNPVDLDGPHGVAMSPDGKFLYVTTAHGTPYGYLWKFDAVSGRELGHVELGMFPATVQVTPDGAFAYLVNFNLHGDMVPSSVSVVGTDDMVEVSRVPTCTMPHGSRINPQGTLQYSACMMDDAVVEIDTRTLEVSRRFYLEKGKEHGETGPFPVAPATAQAMGSMPGMDHAQDPTRAGDMAGHDVHGTMPGMKTPTCSPTWVQPSADGSRIWVACNKTSEIVEIDVAGWTVTRRIPAGEGVYNMTVTHDGKLLIATNKRGKSVSIYDTGSGAELARIPTQRRFVHGAAVSADDRYAFISVEGYGSEPGTVEIIDLTAKTKVASVDVGQMAGGIDFWKTEAGK